MKRIVTMLSALLTAVTLMAQTGSGLTTTHDESGYVPEGYELAWSDEFSIVCQKIDGEIVSGRIKARPNEGWRYGYFEARIKLPKGKGTWPAFWMMPVNVDWNTNPWPRCGEIDIMEEVGYHPNYVSSSIHCDAYNHTKGTQKTHEMYLQTAEDEYHIYGLEWTAGQMTFYVDGRLVGNRTTLGKIVCEDILQR